MHVALESYHSSWLWKDIGREEDPKEGCQGIVPHLCCGHAMYWVLTIVPVADPASVSAVVLLSDTSACHWFCGPTVTAQEAAVRARRQPAEAGVCCADLAGECSAQTAEKVAGQMEKLLEEMHRRLPNTHIIVMAILPKVLRLSRLPY